MAGRVPVDLRAIFGHRSLPVGDPWIFLVHTDKLSERMRRGSQLQGDDLGAVVKPLLELFLQIGESSLAGRALGGQRQWLAAASTVAVPCDSFDQDRNLHGILHGFDFFRSHSSTA
jgi:hypothetical protein